MVVFAKTSEKLVLAGLVAAVAAVILGGVISLKGGWRSLSDGPSSSAATPEQLPQLPRMVIQQRFAGPFPGTEIDRWRDPLDGTVCYIYFPTVVRRTQAPAGYFDYGSNAIGSISCLSAAGQPQVSPSQVPPGVGPSPSR
jgi:hypothetical protein